MTEENRHNRLTGLAVGLLHWLMHRGTTVAAACAERPMRTFALVALFFSAEHFVLGPFSYLDWHDLGNGNYPLYSIISETTKAYGVYYWQPFAGSGVDLMAQGHRVLDLFTGAFLLLPGWLATGGLRFLQLFIAGWFTYRLCRDSLGLSRPASLAGGLFYAFLQRNLMEHYFGFGALPFLAWVLERLHGRAGWTAWALAALLGVGYSLTANLPLAMVFTLPGLFVWLFVVRRLGDRRLIGLMAVFSLFCLPAQAEMAVSMLMNAPLSHRAHWDLESPPFDKQKYLFLVLLWRYLPLVLLTAAGAVLARRRDRSPLIVAGVVAGVFAIMALQQPLRLMAGTELGLLRSFNLTRFGELLPFFLSVGAAWGLHEISRLKREDVAAAWRFSLLGLILPATVALVAFHPLRELAADVRDWVLWGSYTANFQSPTIEAVARELRRSKEPFRVVTTQENGLQAGYVYAYGLEAADGYLNMYPYRYYRFWKLVIQPFLARHRTPGQRSFNYGSLFGLFTDDGHPLELDVKDYFRLNLLSLANVRYILTTVPLRSPNLELVAKTRPDRFWDDLTSMEKLRRRLGENFSGRPVMVYRNRSALRRWFLAADVAFYRDVSELDSRLAETPARELARTALFEAGDAAAFAGATTFDATGRIDVEDYTPDRIVLRVAAKGRTALVVSNTFSPFWRCTVDGIETRILPAYGTFWGVPIGPGEHRVEFRYDPPYRLF